MSGKYLLDTNIIVALFKDDETVRAKLTSASEVFTPVIAIGELTYGAMNSAKVENNLAQVREFAEAVTVLACDLGTAEQYGRIKSELKAKGRPLPENDIWIAALASQHSLTVVTRDQHFNEIEGLPLEKW